MNLAEISIRRPIFITCVVILMLVVGYISLRSLPVDLFPDVTLPVVVVETRYEGAGPEEIETQISKPLEDEISSVAGIDNLRSVNNEGVSVVIAEFKLDVDIKYAEQQVRDRVALAKRKFPDGFEEPVIRTVDPSDSPIVVFSLTADLPEGELYDVANEVIKPRLTQVNKVGKVEIVGGRRREIQVQLDRNRLRDYEISATQVASQIGSAGKNVPVGKIDRGAQEAVFRSVGEYRNLDTIRSTIVRFTGNESPIVVGQLGKVVDTLEDETSRAFVNGQKSIFINVYRQSKANTIQVVDDLIKQSASINELLKTMKGNPALTLVNDNSKRIRDNVYDVNETIIIGIILTVVVVYFFLGSARSTIITGMALPNSLLGAFILMLIAGFSINVMSLLGLSLAVGLLIDDAIVVRENIFRHLEMGKNPHEASLIGTREVAMAVVATTFAILAVFVPIGFLKGVVGQYLKEFALTVVFAMLISLFDALTIAPMMSAYFADKEHGHSEDKKLSRLQRLNRYLLKSFDRFQTYLELKYEAFLRVVMRRPGTVVMATAAIFFGSLYLVKFIPITFIPAQDNGEVSINVDLPPGTSLDAMAKLSHEIDEMVRSMPEVERTLLMVGSESGESNRAMIFVQLVPSKERNINTSQFKDILRQKLKPFAHANPQVGDSFGMQSRGGANRPFNVNIVGADLKQIEEISNKLLEKLRAHPALKDVDTSYRPGKPELQVSLNRERARMAGIQAGLLGQELRAQIQGVTPAVFREQDREYDVRVRLLDEQRDLNAAFRETMIPNINGSLVPLAAVARPVDAVGPATILRSDRNRYIQISADVAANGPGIGAAVEYVRKVFETEIPLPPGVTYRFEGQAKSFGELLFNMVVAMGLGIMFIYLVLSSLYESFITPFAIMTVFPLAICGALIALFVTRSSLDLFSMIACVMLLGLATKNSILLVDYANQRLQEGMSREDAIREAGRTRLRPILMTSFALIAGMIPVAIGLNEASKQRVSLGIATIGGTISSTLLTLVVVPATYSYFDRFRVFVNRIFFRYIGTQVPTSSSRPSGTQGAAGPASAPVTSGATAASAPKKD